MSGLCGWFHPGRAGPASPEVIATMAAPLNRFDDSTVRSASAGFGALAAAGADLDIFQDDHQLVAVWGRVRFTDTGLAALAQRHGVARALEQGYARMGTDVLTTLAGAFALAILDGRGGEAVLAIDRMGTCPLCYSVAGDTLVFGSTLDAISAFPANTPEVNRQAIYDYVYFHMVPGPHTIHVGRHRLLPGSFLLWRNGKAETRSYWEMRFVEDERRPLPELNKGFLDAVRKGVREAAQDGTAEELPNGWSWTAATRGMALTTSSGVT